MIEFFYSHFFYLCRSRMVVPGGLCLELHLAQPILSDQNSSFSLSLLVIGDSCGLIEKLSLLASSVSNGACWSDPHAVLIMVGKSILETLKTLMWLFSERVSVMEGSVLGCQAGCVS